MEVRLYGDLNNGIYGACLRRVLGNYCWMGRHWKNWSLIRTEIRSNEQLESECVADSDTNAPRKLG
jgi:hypothetical protein